MLKFKRVSETQIEEVLKSITSYTEIFQSGSSIKKVSFESSLFGKGYFLAESYSGLEIYLEEKPKFWILDLDDEMGSEDCDELRMAKKMISLGHKFASKKDGQKFISDIGSAKNWLYLKEIDPNKEPEAAKKYTDDLPF